MGDWLVEDGATLDVRRPYAGDALPVDLGDHDGLVILGGSMGADDEATCPWLAQCKALVRGAVEEAVPVLGICLGHQVVAAALGGLVGPNPAGQQIGVLTVGWTEAARTDGLFAPLAHDVRAVQWNDDVVLEPPPGAVVLAETPTRELQAARFAASVWGVQWHPEVDADLIAVWADEDRERAVERGVDVDAYVAAVAEATDELRTAWRGLATGFWAQCQVAGGVA